MIVWTIQHEDILKELDSNYHVKDENILWSHEDVQELMAYNWMIDQMKIRIGKSPNGIKYPIWCWFMWEGRWYRPDKRRSGYGPRGTPLIVIEMDIPKSEILLSDFDLWHYPLNNWYLPASEQDDMKLDENEKLLTMEKSWCRVFDINKEDDGYLYGKNNSKSIQGTIWEIKSEYIMNIQKFIAK